MKATVLFFKESFKIANDCSIITMFRHFYADNILLIIIIDYIIHCFGVKVNAHRIVN